MIALEQEINETIKIWPKISKTISTIHTQVHYKRAIRLLDSLIDSVCEKPDPVKESLIDTLGTLIKDYEDRNIPEPKGDPIGSLKFLMDEHGLKQSHLKEIGSQGIVSEILNGKRKLNVRQIKALSQRFHVSPVVFIEEDKLNYEDHKE
ncbi:MAG: transcriptional regulator [Calditrichaeota bacterium]|nr:MAG: transcriptional regulator [Calditrichota bacterium]